MAVTLPPPDALDEAVPALGDLAAGPPQRGGLLGRLLWAAVLLSLLLGGGYWAWSAWSPGEGEQVGVSLLTHQVKRGKFLVTVTEDGNLESANNRDLKCEVAGGSTILWIIKDGTQVREGDELVRLDSSAIEEQITQQTIVVEKAQAARVQAEREFAAAEIAVREYEEGIFIQELNTLEANVVVALENLRSAENSLQYAQRMSRKGYVNRLQLEAQEFAVERAKLDLAAAETAKRVLQDFTRAKMLEQLNSTRDSAEARMRSEQASFDLETSRLKKLQEQLAHCTIVAPQDGMVVFANEPGNMRSGQQAVAIEEGAQVRERQSIIRLPDLSQMQVKVTVHESKIERLAPDMPARIRIQGREFAGTVVSVANQPEATNWFMGNVKEYATIVKIEGASVDLKPGMTAEVEILVASLDDALTVPLQSVVEVSGRHFCFVQRSGGQPQQTEVELGLASNTAVEIKQGLAEGDVVLLNPPAIESSGGGGAAGADAEDAEADRFGGREPPPPSERPAAPAGDAAGGQAGAGGFDLMQFDKDGDKKISKDEAPEQMAAFFERLDGNADGFLDQKEIAALRARMRQMQQGGGLPGAPPGGGPGG